VSCTLSPNRRCRSSATATAVGASVIWYGGGWPSPWRGSGIYELDVRRRKDARARHVPVRRATQGDSRGKL
jgi:hypothetical protein